MTIISVLLDKRHQEIQAMQLSLKGPIFNDLFKDISFRHTTGVIHTENCLSKGKRKRDREVGEKWDRNKSKECKCTFLSEKSNHEGSRGIEASLKHN